MARQITLSCADCGPKPQGTMTMNETTESKEATDAAGRHERVVMHNENEQKAQAVMEFVEMMIGAYDAGFVDTHQPTLAEVHQVARNHVKDIYGVETKPLDPDLHDACMTGA